MSKGDSKQAMLRPSSPLQGILAMPWDVDRHLGRSAELPKDTVSFNSKSTPDPSLPSPLFRISMDILEAILDRMTKKDVFHLSQTCKDFIQNPAILKKLFYRPISVEDILHWYGDLSGDGLNNIMVPPVTWGINAFTGPSVRQLALPEWTSEQDINYLTSFCPNLDTVDFLEIFRPVQDQRAAESNGNDNGDDDDQEDEAMDFWPPLLDRCPDFFRNLKAVHLPYGCWKYPSTRQHSRYQFNRIAMLPRNLSLAKHLQSLAISCQPMSTRDTSPEIRRKSSITLLGEILSHVNKELTTLDLYESVAIIDNLDTFMHSLTVFPKLRTLKLSLYQDLFLYQKDLHHLYHLGSIMDPILACRNKDYEHDTASVLQYLAVIKNINDKGRFAIVPTDKDCGWRYLPREFYGLSQRHLIRGPGDNHWAPVWFWNDRLQWISDEDFHLGVEVVDVGKCRALFEELIKAHICVSVDLAPQLVNGNGALFAPAWVNEIKYRRYDQEGNAHDENISDPPESLGEIEDSYDPGQHFVWRNSTRITSKSSATYCYKSLVQRRSTDTEQLGNELHDTLSLDPPTTPAMTTSTNPNEQPQATSASSHASNPKPNLPNPVWRLNEVGHLIDDLRIILNHMFAYEYTEEFAQSHDLTTYSEDFHTAIHKCQIHMRDRLWRESEYLALLFRRIPVDFPRLTRLAIYVPAALYPDHDQTFIDRVLPGTGWNVRHHEIGRESVGLDEYAPAPLLDKACLRLAKEMCPFVRRIFTRAKPTVDAAAVVVHEGERHVTKRPMFDLDGGYKSMERLLTEPLRENYEIK